MQSSTNSTRAVVGKSLAKAGARTTASITVVRRRTIRFTQFLLPGALVLPPGDILDGFREDQCWLTPGDGLQQFAADLDDAARYLVRECEDEGFIGELFVARPRWIVAIRR